MAYGVFHKLKLILSRFMVCRTLSKNRKELEVKLWKKRKEVVNVGGCVRELSDEVKVKENFHAFEKKRLSLLLL